MLEIKNLNVAFDDFSLRDITLTINRNEFFVLMGPTGTGKTVLLESLMGLIKPRSGTIKLNKKDISTLPPEKRKIGIVYQDCALFPHMSVRDNILYGCRYQTRDERHTKEGLEQLTATLARELAITHLLHRRPETLSGGEMQRTALARALITKPEILLLDEPLSALDPQFRREIQDLLRSLHDNTGTTFLMVTHDFSEALALGERGAVMNQGRIEQVDRIDRIFQKPRTRFTAEFVGMTNIFPVQYKDGEAHCGAIRFAMEIPAEGTGLLALRPEDIVLSPAPLESSMRNTLEGIIASLCDRGFYVEVLTEVENRTITALITRGAAAEFRLHPGKTVYLSCKSSALHAF